MRKTIIYIFLLLLFNCSSDSSSDGESNTNNNNDSRIEVTIDGTRFVFNNIVFEKHFEDPLDKYYYVTATIEGRNDLVIDFDVTIGYFQTNNNDQSIGEFNLLVFDDFTQNNIPDCSYWGVEIYSPYINITVNTETEFKATFECNNRDGFDAGPESMDCLFGEDVDYTNGIIELYL